MLHKGMRITYITILVLLAVTIVMVFLELKTESIILEFETQGAATIAASKSGKYGSAIYLKVSIPESVNPVIVLVPEEFPIKHNSYAKLHCKKYESSKIKCNLMGYL